MGIDLFPLGSDPTLEALNQQLIRDNPQTQRVYLGGSAIGKACWRQLWYDLRWVQESIHDAATLARFADGHASEAIVGARLSAIPGIRLWTEQEDGTQYGFVDLGGHLRGHLDGVIMGLLQAPKTPHVWEAKAVNERKFKDLEKKKTQFGEKDALENWDSTYFAQAQMYMGQFKYTRHYLTVATPGSRDITSCRTDFQKNVYDRLMGKAKRIVFSGTPLDKISTKSDYYICKWCDYTDNCHGSKVARVNCRTCAHVTPTDSGTWRCEFHGKTLTNKEQRAGCSKHLFIPELVPFGTLTDMDQDANTITYQTESGTSFINAETNDWEKSQFTSKDLQHLDADLLDGDHDFFSSMSRFDGASITSIVKAKEKPMPEVEASFLNPTGGGAAKE